VFGITASRHNGSHMRDMHPLGSECFRSSPQLTAIIHFRGLALACSGSVGDPSSTGGSGASPATGGASNTGGSSGVAMGGSSAAGGIPHAGSSGMGVDGNVAAGSGGSSGVAAGGALGACEPVAPPEQRVVRLTFA
jgi:hypothetical protein